MTEITSELLNSLKDDFQKLKQVREQKCLEEVTAILQKYGCTIKCTITFDELKNQVIYDKKIVALDN